MRRDRLLETCGYAQTPYVAVLHPRACLSDSESYESRETNKTSTHWPIVVGRFTLSASSALSMLHLIIQGFETWHDRSTSIFVFMAVSGVLPSCRKRGLHFDGVSRVVPIRHAHMLQED